MKCATSDMKYADETGPVTWEVAKKHVEEVLLTNK